MERDIKLRKQNNRNGLTERCFEGKFAESTYGEPVFVCIDKGRSPTTPISNVREVVSLTGRVDVETDNESFTGSRVTVDDGDVLVDGQDIGQQEDVWVYSKPE